MDRCARGLLALGIAQGRPRRHLGAQPRRVDDHPVRHRQDRRDPRQHQPGVPAARAGVRARTNPAASALVDRAQLPHDRLHWRCCTTLCPELDAHPRRAHLDAHRSSRTCATSSGWATSAAPGMWVWGEVLERAEEVSAEELAARQAEQEFDDPINIQYTSGTTGNPEGRDAQPPQHPQQRLLRRAAARLHRARPALHPGAALPLLRHGDGQPGLHDARRDDGLPRGGVRAGGRAGGGAGRALHRALRRADDVHRRAGPPGLRPLRPHHRCAPA